MRRPSRHNCRQLKGERLAAASREYRKQRLAIHCGLHCILLHGLAVELAEFIKTEHITQSIMDLEFIMAIRTVGVVAWCVTQQFYNILYLRIVNPEPRRCYRVTVVGIDKRQSISQLHRILLHKQIHTAVRTYLSLK